ncbi:MAG TPA: GNAT family protein [Streptosporangiaceae bacterium]|nr:GNAT family protein [Streptosporangiaceae bacterium]
MTVSRWPLDGLRLTTPRLELRWPALADLGALADLAAGGIHDPEVQPFGVAWTDVPADERAQAVLQWHWSTWGSWTPSDWSLNLVVDQGGAVVGTQGLIGRDFAILREVSTGSWLGRDYQGQGIGTEMRAAILFLAFEGLHAEYATSGAFEDNAASLAVSRKLGYSDDGIDRQVSRGRPATVRRLRLDRAAWEARRSVPVEIHGLEACLPGFGIAA